MKLYVVLGLGQFGQHTAATLSAGGGEVLAIDRDERRVDVIKDQVSQAVCMDATDISALRAVGVAKAETAIVALGEEDLEASILACAALSDLGVGYIVARGANDLQGRILQRVGASRILYPEREMGERLARSLLVSGVLDQVTLSTGQTVAQIEPNPEFVGKTLQECNLPARFGIIVIGIQKTRRSVDDRGEMHTELDLNSVPGPDEIINKDDVLVVVGNIAQIERLVQRHKS